MLPAIINFVHYVGLYFNLLKYSEMTIVAFSNLYLQWQNSRFSQLDQIKCALEVFTD